TPLAPGDAISNTPYSVTSLIADAAVNAATAGNATQLGGLAASTYLQTNGNGSQLTNINGANITNNTISVSALSAGVTVNATTNSSLLGSLRWDLLALRNFTVDSPRYVASDGANIWVTSFGGNTVTKMRVTDGTVLGTFAVGTGPTGVVFDGSNIWVANNSS